ncbi:unnamed protein product [Peniophora sp. CBMAI 1063]|nr:unnamed protein product [Peniophora sp. CBMAI 1063]
MATALSPPHRPCLPFSWDRSIVAVYVRDTMAYHFHAKGQSTFTDAFFVEHAHPDFIAGLKSAQYTRNKVLGQAHRKQLAWNILKDAPMPVCSFPECEGHTLTERGDFFVTRNIVGTHFPEFKTAPVHLKEEITRVARQYIDYVLIGDLANTRQEWKDIQKGKVDSARPTRSSRCPDGWLERRDPIPLSPQAEAWKAAHPVEETSKNKKSTRRAATLLPGSFTPSASASPTLHAPEDEDDNADMKSLFGDDLSDTFSISSSDDTRALDIKSWSPLNPACIDLDTHAHTDIDTGTNFDFDTVAYPPLDCSSGRVILKGSTGELINEDTGEPLPCHQVFGYPAYIINPPRPYESLEDLFTPPRPLPETECQWWLPPPTQQDQVSLQEPDTHVDLHRNDNLPVQPSWLMAY